MMMYFWMVVIMVIVVTVGMATVGDNHNGKKHDTLCGLLSAAVSIFQSGKGGPVLRKALQRAIFGGESGALSLKTLIETPPEEFKNPGRRANWCGACRYIGEAYPGKSIPHDLICLCTVGENGYPFKESSITKLCGLSATELGCSRDSSPRCEAGDGEGWSELSTGTSAKEHIDATWKTAVAKCLREGLKLDLEK
ncbi:unnamed protein product, partial [Trypanosoma congolense IL3000]